MNLTLLLNIFQALRNKHYQLNQKFANHQKHPLWHWSEEFTKLPTKVINNDYNELRTTYKKWQKPTPHNNNDY